MANIFNGVPENLCEWCCCRKASHLVPREFLDVWESWERCQKQCSSKMRSDCHPQARCQCIDYPEDYSDHDCDSCEDDCLDFCKNRSISWDDDDCDECNEGNELCFKPKFCDRCEDSFRNTRNLALQSFTTITPREGGFDINTGINWPHDKNQFCTCISDGDNAKLCCNCMKSCVDLREKPRACTCRQFREKKEPKCCTCEKPEPKCECVEEKPQPEPAKCPRRLSRAVTENVSLPGIPEIESTSDTNIVKNTGILKNASETLSPSPIIRSKSKSSEKLERDSNLFSVDSNNSILPDLNAKIYRKSMEDSLPILPKESDQKTIASVLKVEPEEKVEENKIPEPEIVAKKEEDVCQEDDSDNERCKCKCHCNCHCPSVRQQDCIWYDIFTCILCRTQFLFVYLGAVIVFFAYIMACFLTPLIAPYFYYC